MNEARRVSAPPVVLLPGMACSSRLWQPVADLLVADTACMHVDLVGSTIDQMVDHVLAKAPARFSLAGLSLGGIVAMALAQRAPNRITNLALVSTSARPPRSEQRQEWQHLEHRTDSGEFVQAALAALLPSDAAADLREQALAMVAEVGAERFRNQLHAQASRVDLRPGLSAVDHPTMVLAGEGDHLCPMTLHEEITSLLPTARLQTIPECGHLAPLEQPRTVASHLSDFLQPTSRKPAEDSS